MVVQNRLWDQHFRAQHVHRSIGTRRHGHRTRSGKFKSGQFQLLSVKLDARHLRWHVQQIVIFHRGGNRRRRRGVLEIQHRAGIYWFRVDALFDRRYGYYGYVGFRFNGVFHFRLGRGVILTEEEQLAFGFVVRTLVAVHCGTVVEVFVAQFALVGFLT